MTPLDRGPGNPGPQRRLCECRWVNHLTQPPDALCEDTNGSRNVAGVYRQPPRPMLQLHLLFDNEPPPDEAGLEAFNEWARGVVAAGRVPVRRPCSAPAGRAPR